jgi:hypothetical protein
MVRKRASLKDKGEEILGVKRGGQGADILFGGGTEAQPAAMPEAEGIPEVPAPEEERMPQGEADLDESLRTEAEAAQVAGLLSAEAEYPAAAEGLPRREADLDQELDLESLLSAEAEAAEGETTLPELATTPAASAPPPPEPITPTPPPPAVERPLPAPPPGVVRPMPAPPPATTAPPSSSPAVVQPASAPPPSGPAAIPPPQVGSPPPSPTPAVAPPSTATGAPDLSVPRPPRYIQMVSGDFDLLAEETSADAAAAALIGVPEGVRLTVEQREELLRRRSVQQELAELDRAIEAQYDRILRENISVNKDITDWCHNMLAEARTIVLHRQVDKLDRAEWSVEQVRARLDRAGESRKQANRFAWPITLWGVAWFGIFVFLIFKPMLVLQYLASAESGETFLVPEIFLRSLFFGGIGGVAAVFYHLFKYMQQRSFDSQYGLSYVAKPFMGMILGSMIYLTVFVVMRVLGLAPIGLEQAGTQTVTDVMYMALLFFVAMAAGFKENLAFDLLNRVIKTVLRSDQDAKGPSTPPPSSTTTGA